jgi:peptide/nickel transport system substrate-binding protein
VKKIFTVILYIVLCMSGAYANQINVAISAAPNNLSPFFSTDANSQNINRLLHISLIDFNSKMEFECRGCKTFKESVVNGKHMLDFELRSDLVFTDGTPVTSQDVVNSWKYFSKDEKIKSTFMGAFESLENVEVFDKYKFKIIFKNFSLENLSNLALLKIVKITKENHAGLEAQEIIGAGAYLLKSVEPLEVLIEPRDKIKPSLVFKVVKDETTLALKLINKEIDLSVASMSPRKVNWLKNKTKFLKVWDMPSGNYQFIGLNHKREVFKDLKLRKALSLLIPREDLLKYKMKNTVALSNGMFSPAFAEMHTDRPIDPYNPEEARKIFRELGFEKSKEGKLIRAGKPLEFDWKVSNNKASIEVVEIIKNYFEKEGIVVNMTIQEWGTFMSSFKGGKFDIVVGQWVGFTGPDMLRFVFHSTNTPPKGGNRISYNNPLFDKVVDQATIETDKKKRTILYKEADKIVTDDFAYLSLWHPNIIWIGSNCLKNIELEPTGSFASLPKVEKNCE